MPTEPATERESWGDLQSVSAQRSFTLMGAGALLGLVLAGYSLFTARGTSTLHVPAEDVALVNQQPISRIDYLLQLQAVYGVDLSHASTEQRRKILNDMIREELFVERGKELDVASSDPEVRNAMVNAVENEIAQDAITSKPSEAALRSYFDAHAARYASEGIMTVRDLIFPEDGTASVNEAIDALRKGPPTPALLAEYHAKRSARIGDEEFYFAARIHLGDRLFEIARTMSDAAVSAPVRLDDGIHVLYMEKNTRPAPFDFAAARDAVLTDYRKDAIAHSNAGDEAFLRRRANILIADDLR